MQTMMTTTENVNEQAFRQFDSKRAKIEINQSKYKSKRDNSINNRDDGGFGLNQSVQRYKS